MIVPYIILLVIIVAYIIDFKKSYVIVVLLSSWIQQFSFLPKISLSQVVIFLSVAFFVMKIDKNRTRERNIFSFSIFFLSVSYFLSCYFSVGERHNLILMTSICGLFYITMFWNIVKNSPSTLIVFSKAALVYAVFCGTYIVFEAISQTNPVVEYFNNSGAYIQTYLIDSIRYGVKRCQGVFSMHTTAGAVCLSLAYLVWHLYYRTKLFLNIHPIIILYAIVTCSAGVFLTGARSAIVGFAVCILLFLPVVKRNFFSYFLVGIIVLFLMSPYLDLVFSSFYDTESVTGSNIDLRETQFRIAFLFWSHNWWIGNGLNYTFENALSRYPDLMGAESVWLSLVIDRGLLGIISFSFFLITSFYYCYKEKSVFLVLFLFGFLMFFTLSSIPNYSFYIPLIYVIAMIESKKQFGKTKADKNIELIRKQYLLKANPMKSLT